MGSKVMGPASTETTDVRPYIQLPVLVNGQTHFLTFLLIQEVRSQLLHQCLAPNNKILYRYRE
jgi:hypothetical protein